MRLDQQILLKSPPLSLLTVSASALRAHVNTLINEKNVKYEVATLSVWDIAIYLEKPHKICRSSPTIGMTVRGLCGGQKMAPHVNKWSPLDGAHE